MVHIFLRLGPPEDEYIPISVVTLICEFVAYIFIHIGRVLRYRGQIKISIAFL